MTQEIAKYNVHTKAHKRKLIKRWLIAIVVLAIIIWAFAGVPSLELKSKSLEILKSIFSGDRKSTRLNSSHLKLSRMPSSA